MKIIGEIEQQETIARGSAIREQKRLIRRYGKARWRKMKGFALVELPDESRWLAEVHWYQAHGIGSREIKIKRLIEER